jgi:hypothetical protein
MSLKIQAYPYHACNTLFLGGYVRRANVDKWSRKLKKNKGKQRMFQRIQLNTLQSSENEGNFGLKVTSD